MCQTNYETHPLAHGSRCCYSKLKRLDLYLLRLPSSLAITESFSHYNLTQFSLDLDWVLEAIGSVVGAVNCELEVQLGMCAMANWVCGTRSPSGSTCGVLYHYSTQFPDNILLETWMMCWWGQYTPTKRKYTVALGLPRHLQITLQKLTWFDPVMQKSFHLWLMLLKLLLKKMAPVTTEPIMKHPLQSSDVAEYTSPAKWPKQWKKVQTE